MSALAPVICFVYNRPVSTRRTLECLMANKFSDESVLYIYADGPKENANEMDLNRIIETRKVIREKKWCREIYIVENKKNKGLANSIIDGVTEVVNQFGKTIVLEDDLITATGFLEFLNKALVRYENEEKIMQISGHVFPADINPSNTSFFLTYANTLGWGTWKWAWKYFDKDALGYLDLKDNHDLSLRFDLQNSYPFTQLMLKQMESKTVDSWGIRWWWSIFKQNGLTLFPDKTLVKHIENSEGGTHVSGSYIFDEPDFDINYEIRNFPKKIEIDLKNFQKVKEYLKEKTKSFYGYGTAPSFETQIKNKLQAILGMRIYSSIKKIWSTK